jgi:Zn-dependent peptidase ImmA (M78 family)
MSRSSPEINIAPDVFRWLCGSSGWKATDIAKKIDIPEDTVRLWCKGEISPSMPLGKVEQLAIAFKRPLATFLLPAPPKELKLPPDFRKLPGTSTEFSKTTHLVLRKARHLQGVRRELMENLGLDVSVSIRKRRLKDNPETVADEERAMVGLLTGYADARKTSSEILSFWRDWFERENISVFQMEMPVEDARGFSFIDENPYIIVINESDSINGRIFTLFHEYGHILLNEPALCNRDSDDSDDERIAQIERWCNHFAGAFLMPKDLIESDPLIIRHIRSSNFDLAAGSIGNRFKVSKEAGLMRLLTLGYIPPSIFRNLRDKVREKVAEQRESQRAKLLEQKKQKNLKSSGGPAKSLDQKCIEEKGQRFISLVLKNSNLGYISSSEALDYLDIKLRHLDKMRV